jgi:hypothetical protein
MPSFMASGPRHARGKINIRFWPNGGPLRYLYMGVWTSRFLASVAIRAQTCVLGICVLLGWDPHAKRMPGGVR